MNPCSVQQTVVWSRTAYRAGESWRVRVRILQQYENISPKKQSRQIVHQFSLLHTVACVCLSLCKYTHTHSGYSEYINRLFNNTYYNLNLEHVIDGITRSYEGTELATTPTVTSPLPERWRRRDKRGLLELAGVVKCSTGRSAVAYIMYGCYCGLGGQGWPRDKADW